MKQLDATPDDKPARRRKVKQTQPMIIDEQLLSSLFRLLQEKSTARFKAAKQLQLISIDKPEALYSHFSIFAGLLHNTSSVLLWNGIIIIAHLARVDSKRRFDTIFHEYYAHLWDGKLITAANILGNSGHIIKYRPDLTERIVPELLSADVIPLPTPTCREVARGSVLISLIECFPQVKDDQRVFDFVKRCTQSFRPPVKKKAEMLLSLMGHP